MWQLSFLHDLELSDREFAVFKLNMLRGQTWLIIKNPIFLKKETSDHSLFNFHIEEVKLAFRKTLKFCKRINIHL